MTLRRGGPHRIRPLPDGTVNAVKAVNDTTVHGPVIQARAIGNVSLVPSPPTARDGLGDAADRLARATRDQWRREEERRKLRDPVPLLVRWRPAAEDLTDHWANIHGSADGSVRHPLPLAGRLDGITDLHRRVPSRRLVVLGRPGSGKTVLTIRFVLELLRARTDSADPVPVLFNLGTWGPDTPLRDWLVGQLERDHPALAEPRPGGPATTWAAALVGADRILPVLDGFDEIAGGLRRRALEALNDTNPLPLLLTSRHDAYAAAVAGSRALTAAAAVELTDLSLAEVAQYLPRTARRMAAGATRWDDVLADLRDHPERPARARLVTALTTPLMVALARAVYSDLPDRDPGELLDGDRFRTVEAIEDHLLDSFLPAVYRDERPARRDRHVRGLTFLARHLTRLGTHDLEWWNLGGTLGRPTRTAVVGTVAGAAFGLVDVVTVLWCVLPGQGLGFARSLGLAALNGVPFAVTAALLFGLVYGLAHGKVTGRPSRVRVRLLGGTCRTRELFTRRLAYGFLGGFGLSVVGWLLDSW
ncbi:Sio3 (plasmid) [Streptantibioticus cattleyicolor NRRL 8057 = DSM 46488]|uniref:Sio3 n=1 Tax=Streptantibioticus cattleyicolor (strain ATCC 35852 / DSM 46488 / JCM 4925 / NBRC 14057 / NRRL 8057) TaxID=1003195 RepID=F8JKU8_STREN